MNNKTEVLFSAVHSGVCRISVILGDYIASGSAFLVNKKLVTCGHVYLDLPPNSNIDFSFSDGGSFSVPQSIVRGSCRAPSDGNSFDYCVLGVQSRYLMGWIECESFGF
jgi:hypothetical protein